ncbi:MAG: three-Cys-motif partner protein TcmP [Pirellulales bacterium]|nr:three-Cys-motif partner protein TcmP [Pirellulales bacterium]
MERAIDLWRDLCEVYKEPDGLPTWEEGGQWTKDKLYFWKRYIDTTTKAMSGASGHRAFPGGLVYVDLFGGAGVCTPKGCPSSRFPGSAIIAAHAPNPFTKIIVCEMDPSMADACRTRLDKTPAAGRCSVLEGDCNERIEDVVRLIPPRTLTLAFVDPKGLDARFSTVTTLSQNARVDFVVLFADAIDVIRNMEHVYRQNPNSKLDLFLGPDSNWREELSELINQHSVEQRKLFADIYKKQLERLLGYRYFDQKVMESGGKSLYRLVYASKSELGVKFWKDALKENSSGQRDFLF